MLLALDTATRHSGIALFDGQQLVAELTWHSTDAQTVELMPRLAQLLSWHGLEPKALSAIAVSLGPGSYTGLRVAVSAAKGLALANDLPLLGIPTLDATAFPHLGRPEGPNGPGRPRCPPPGAAPGGTPNRCTGPAGPRKPVP